LLLKSILKDAKVKALKIQLLMTGNELLSGDILDSNSAMIAQSLKDLGLEVKRKVTVSDDIELLTQEIITMSQQTDILIINGGLGPTIDDMTAQALANAANKSLIEHPQALAHLESWCNKRKTQLSKPNLKQAMLPSNCNIIANEIGSAVGINLTLNNCEIFSTPGVPKELKVMLSKEIMPLLNEKTPPEMALEISRFQVYGHGESSLQKLIDETYPNWPDEIELGFRASMPLLEVKLTSRSTLDRSVKNQWRDNLKILLGDHLVNEIHGQPVKLAEKVLSLLQKEEKKITTAESCTGGLIANLITEISGSSKSFEAGYITYSNTIKSKLLDVSATVISQHGAVSKETVLAMAKGALNKSKADVVVAVSGIAGPQGGTIEKPVGTVWVAWGYKNKLQNHKLQLHGERIYIQQHVAAIGLDLIRRLLINSQETPNYLK